MNGEQTELARLQAAFVQIEAATTKASVAQVKINAGVSAVLQKIKDNPDSTPEIKTAADSALALVGKLAPLADALEQMGKDLNDAVPVEPVDPTIP